MGSGVTNQAARVAPENESAAQAIRNIKPAPVNPRLLEGAGSASDGRLFGPSEPPARTEPLTREELFTPFERAIPSLGGFGDFVAEAAGIIPGNRDRILAAENAEREEAAISFSFQTHKLLNEAADRLDDIKNPADRAAAAQVEAAKLDDVSPGIGNVLLAQQVDLADFARDFRDDIQADPPLLTALLMGGRENDLTRALNRLGSAEHQRLLRRYHKNKFLEPVTNMVVGGLAQLEKRARLKPDGEEAKALALARKDGKIDTDDWNVHLNKLVTSDFAFNPDGNRNERIAWRVFEDNADTIEGFRLTETARKLREEIDLGKTKQKMLRDPSTGDLHFYDTAADSETYQRDIKRGFLAVGGDKEQEKDPALAANRREANKAAIRKRILSERGIEDTQAGLYDTNTGSFVKLSAKDLKEINAEVNRQHEEQMKLDFNPSDPDEVLAAARRELATNPKYKGWEEVGARSDGSLRIRNPETGETGTITPSGG